MNESELEQTEEFGRQEEPELLDKRFFAGIAINVLKAYTSKIPLKLYHYTSSEGLRGIISKNCFWFSDTRFLNDASENLMSINIAQKAIVDFLATNPDIPKDVGERLLKQIEIAKRTLVPVIFCMSGENNLLNQWRDYGKDVVPYSLEIDVDEILQNDRYTFPTMLLEVIYDPRVMLDMCRDFLNQLQSRYEAHYADTQPNEEEERELYYSAAFEFIVLALSFKNPAFEAEKEWRMITTVVDLSNLKIDRFYRSSNLGVVPYFEWGRRDKGNLPITLVTVGPSPYAQVSDLALKEFLDDHGYPPETQYSLIPIRR